MASEHSKILSLRSGLPYLVGKLLHTLFWHIWFKRYHLYWFSIWRRRPSWIWRPRLSQNIMNIVLLNLRRAVASLTVPGGQELHFPNYFLKFRSIFLIFRQTLPIFFLLGWGTRPLAHPGEGSCYATESVMQKLVGNDTLYAPLVNLVQEILFVCLFVFGFQYGVDGHFEKYSVGILPRPYLGGVCRLIFLQIGSFCQINLDIKVGKKGHGS